ICPTGNFSGKKENTLTPDDWKIVQTKMKKNPHIRSDWTINFSMKVECPGGREKVAITPYGEVMGCGMNYVSFGNIREEPLKNIWQRMSNFPHFKKRSTDCLIGADQEYIDEYLIPLSEYQSLPIRINEHPKNPITFQELDEGH
ncbi:MAG: SPASM domain-containing protein, partial [Oligoflexia bacterium]|nr:SPASM domain-containing protein [Oligoflexia bacterium]